MLAQQPRCSTCGDKLDPQTMECGCKLDDPCFIRDTQQGTLDTGHPFILTEVACLVRCRKRTSKKRAPLYLETAALLLQCQSQSTLITEWRRETISGCLRRCNSTGRLE